METRGHLHSQVFGGGYLRGPNMFIIASVAQAECNLQALIEINARVGTAAVVETG